MSEAVTRVSGPQRDRPRRWESSALGGLEWVACPGLAGLACSILMLGVVTWLPALCATGEALRRWREDGDGDAFVGVFRSFAKYWHSWAATSTMAGLAAVMLIGNGVFLFRQGSLPALALLVVQLFLLAALINYLVWLAVLANSAGPDATATLRRVAVGTAFGRPSGWLPMISGAAVALLLLPTGIGTPAFAPSACLLVAQALNNHERGESRT